MATFIITNAYIVDDVSDEHAAVKAVDVFVGSLLLPSNVFAGRIGVEEVRDLQTAITICCERRDGVADAT